MSCVTRCVVLACDDSIVEPGNETGAWLDGPSLSGITAEYRVSRKWHKLISPSLLLLSLTLFKEYKNKQSKDR